MIGTIVIVFVSLASPAFLLLFYFLVGYIRHVVTLRNYPPGPFPLPVLGNVLLLRENALQALRDTAKKYGDIFSFSIAHKRFVVINSIDIAREALVKKGDKVSGRVQDNCVGQIITRNNRNLGCADGHRWKQLRKMAHTSLQMYGYGMEKLEDIIVTESKHLHTRLSNLKGEPTESCLPQMGLVFMNVICAMMFGNRYELDDKDFVDICQVTHLLTLAGGKREIVSFFPFLRVLPIFESLALAKQAVAIRDPILERQVQQHQDTFDPNNIRDFTDALIKYSKEVEASGGHTTKDDIPMILADMVFAGVDTGMNTVSFGVLFLMHKSEYQDILYQEMKDVLGEGVYPTLRDRCRLPMLNATIMEILRKSCVAALGVPHRTMEDVELGGCFVPKDTYMLFNIWSINHDDRHWQNPEEFDPKRWLDKDGSVLTGAKQSYLTFGAGRRNCLGEALAKAEVFLVLSRLIVDFKFEMADKDSLPSLEPDVSFVMAPKPCSMKFVPRR